MKFMKPLRQEKINSLLKNLAATFLSRETTGSLVTITRVETSRDLKSAKIFISIFPENKEKEALNLLDGKKGELRKYIGSQIKNLKLKVKSCPGAGIGRQPRLKIE